jgi:large subunit ribosomal protein L29
MALPKIEDVRKLEKDDLSAEILAVKRELFQLRLEQATRRLEKPHLFKHAKHRLAQLLTVEREREIAAAKGE